MVAVNAESGELEVPIWLHIVQHVLAVLSGGSALLRRDIMRHVIEATGLSEFT